MFSRHAILATTIVVIYVGFKILESRYFSQPANDNADGDTDGDEKGPDASIASVRQIIRDSILVFLCSFATIYIADMFERPLATFFSMITGHALTSPNDPPPSVFLGPPNF